MNATDTTDLPQGYRECSFCDYATLNPTHFERHMKDGKHMTTFRNYH